MWDDFELQLPFLFEEFGVEILLNEVNTKAIIIEREPSRIVTNMENNISIISTLTLKSGDCIIYNNKYYFIVSTPIVRKGYNYATMKLANHYISYYSQKVLNNYNLRYTYPVAIKYPTIIDNFKTVLQFNSGQDLTGNLITFTTQNTSTIKQLIYGDRIIKFGMVWEIVGISEALTGLAVITCKPTNTVSGDNFIDEIPAGFENYPAIGIPMDLGGDSGIFYVHYSPYIPPAPLPTYMFNFVNKGASSINGELQEVICNLYKNGELFTKLDGNNATWQVISNDNIEDTSDATSSSLATIVIREEGSKVYFKGNKLYTFGYVDSDIYILVKYTDPEFDYTAFSVGKYKVEKR